MDLIYKNSITLLTDNDDFDDRLLTKSKLEPTKVLGKVVGWKMPANQSGHKRIY